MPIARVFALCLTLARAGGGGTFVKTRGMISESPSGKTDGTDVTVGFGDSRPDDNLNAVLYVQTAAEYVGLCGQAYAAAALALDGALVDPEVSADLAQVGQGGYENLPPAIVVDVDETVLDNSPYQASLVRSGGRYSSEGWLAWTARAAAEPVPGALDYLQAATTRGVTIFYVTNRTAPEEAATRRNLARLGFPIDSAMDVVLTKGERPEWRSSDKTPRRAEVAREYRTVQLIGDFREAEPTPEARQRMADAYADYWGAYWIVLPNPTYGDWETVLYGRDYSLGVEEARGKKRGWLRD